MSFKVMPVNEFTENPFTLIGKEWMLVTAGDSSAFNTMTASWGTVGEMWNKPVAITVIRPQRFTNEFVDSNEYFTLSFMGTDLNSRKIHKICGNKSGRDIDKAATAGLTPMFDENSVYFDQARLVLVCKKIYKQQLTPDGVLDQSITKLYNDDYHFAYVGEIVKILVKE